MLSAFIAAFTNAIEVLASKQMLARDRVPTKTLLGLGSALIFLVSIIFFVFWGEIDYYAISSSHWMAFGLIIIVAYFYNYLYYDGLKGGMLCDVEPIIISYPLITMILAMIIYPDERNLQVVIPALIAGFALIYSRYEKNKLKINKYSIAMLGYAILAAVEAIFIKYTLEVMSPIALFTFRIGILSVLFLLFAKPNLSKFKKASWPLMILISIVVPIELMTLYTAIDGLGLVVANLIFLIGPILILTISRYMFKEKVTLRKAISNIVVLICIAAAIIVT